MLSAKLHVYSFVVSFLLSSWAQAQTLQQEQLEQNGLSLPPAEQGRDWSLAIGGGFSVGPTYEGAKNDRVRPIPLLPSAAAWFRQRERTDRR